MSIHEATKVSLGNLLRITIQANVAQFPQEAACTVSVSDIF